MDMLFTRGFQSWEGRKGSSRRGSTPSGGLLQNVKCLMFSLRREKSQSNRAREMMIER